MRLVMSTFFVSFIVGVSIVAIDMCVVEFEATGWYEGEAEKEDEEEKEATEVFLTLKSGWVLWKAREGCGLNDIVGLSAMMVVGVTTMSRH